MLLKIEPKIQISNLREFAHWVPTVSRWHHEEWFKASGLPADDPTIEEKYLEREAALRDHLADKTLPVTFVAHNGGNPIGTVSLVYYTFKDNQAPREWLSNLYVVPEYRCSGIASELLDVALNYARDLRLQRLYLYTRDQENFYKKRNWRFLMYGKVQQQRVSVLDFQL